MMPASMERPTFNALLQGLPVLGRTGDGSVRVTTIVTDSRRVIPGALFFALPGLRANGHAFLDDVIARGAAAIISGFPAFPFPVACFLIVPTEIPWYGILCNSHHAVRVAMSPP
jgi:UDP-N-acetylmuramyl pentapeptide synthase